jgi:cytochrome oxidase Cu insertion factor (SCO1/SenC/PrrC family)
MLKRIVLQALCLLAFCSFASAKTPRHVANVPVNLPGGKSLNLETQYKGKVILLVMMSTTCEDCQLALQDLMKMQNEFKGRPFQAVAVACEPDADKLLGPYLDRFRPTIPVGFYNREQMFKMADFPDNTVATVPVFLFIDRAGTVRFQYQANDSALRNRPEFLRNISGALMREQ